jgi:HSP20 family molecular chaperone IbpA
MKNYEPANLPSALWNDPFLPTDRLFDNLISSTFPEFRKTFGVDAIQKASYPKVNILETNAEIRFVAEIAGLTKDDVTISIKDQPYLNSNYNGAVPKILAISGKKESEKKDDNVKYLLRELKHSYFERTFVINDHDQYDFDNVSAKHENGVLTISIPKLNVKSIENTVKYIKVD